MKRFSRLILIACVCAAGAAEDGKALFQAIRNNDLAFLTAQLKSGADVNTRDQRGSTLLMHAAAFGSAPAVKLLLDAGADVNAKNSFDATALVWGAADGPKLRMLLEKGAGVNVRTKQGRTPLMVAAACSGCSENVRLLLEKGADAKARDVRGATPLQLAAASDTGSVKLVLAAGADADSKGEDGNTPLLAAITDCNLASVKLLLAKGANVNAAITFAGKVKFGPIQLVGLTPLLVAAPYCPVEMTKTLLDAGAKVNAKDVREMTALMLSVASETQSTAVVRALLAAGAEVNAKSKAGETALDWAKKFGNKDVIAALTTAGAKAGDPVTQHVRAAAKPRTVIDAVAISSGLIQRASTGFFQQSGCVGCHHQPLTTVALAAAKSHGAPVDEPALRNFVQMMESDWTGGQEFLLERMDPGGLADGEEYSAWAMGAMRYAPSTVTDTVAVHVAAMQMQAGNWHVGDASRAPVQESEIARTARALHALQLYGPPARRAEFAERIARARDWIARAKPATNDDAAMQLAGLYWAGVPRDRLNTLGRALIAAQRPDGGWAQNRNLASDPFATGESLWTLYESGILPPASPAYRNGVKFLLDSQWPDGSWYVASRAPKFQPYFQSGFPFEHDQWVSSAATAWAVLGLAPAVDNSPKAVPGGEQ